MKSLPKKAMLLSMVLVALISLGSKTSFCQASDWIAPKSADALKNPFKGDAQAAEQGKMFFTTICFVCHGNQGKGDGINAASLERKPANLTSRAVQRQSDGALFWKISEGNPPMLSFKDALSEEQRWQVVNYIRELARLYGKPKAETASTNIKKKSVKTDIVTAGKSINVVNVSPPGNSPKTTASAFNPFKNMHEGKALFKNICGACHTVGKGKLIGPDLKGATSRHSQDWLLKWVRSSQSVIKSGDAVAVQLYEENNKVLMPDQPFLSDLQIKTIFSYIDEQGNSAKTQKRTASNSGSKVASQTPQSTTTGLNKSWTWWFFYSSFLFVFLVLLYLIDFVGKNLMKID
jgi:mono/diheme cytochrome c family protein